MRRLIIALVLLAACKKSSSVQHMELPPPSPPSAAAPAAAPPAPEPVAPAAPPPADEPTRSEPPSTAELGAQLEPLLKELKGCVRGKGVTDAGPRLELHVRVEPAGEVQDASIVGLDAAHDCVRDTMKKLRLPAWKGTPTLVVLPLTSSGDPMRAPAGDGG